jgi:hypothetical protein
MSRSSHPVKIRCSSCGRRFSTEFKLTGHDRRAHPKPADARRPSRDRFVETEIDDEGYELYASGRTKTGARAANVKPVSGHDRRGGNTPPNPNHHATRGIHNG